MKVRRAHFQDGLSGRRIALDFGISRDSVSKMLAYSEPPGYRRTAPVKRPRLDGFTDQIDQWLLEDKVRPRKQADFGEALVVIGGVERKAYFLGRCCMDQTIVASRPYR